eukprot:Ihof_evm1s744 gene=Ihof_evmTU1s744
MVINTEYYDLLNVTPTASDDDIRRGYLRQARRWHPDKNGGDNKAEERFKAIGDAYKVLSDPNLRCVYDEKGKDATAEAQSRAGIDPLEQTKEVCRALFGFGKFDTIFGDPTTFPLFVIAMKMMTRMSAQSSNEIEAPIEIRDDMDRAEREKIEKEEKELIIDLGIILREKMKKVTNRRHNNMDNMEMFATMCANEAEYLSNSPGGDDLVEVVGYIYVQEAKQHMARYMGVEKIWSEIEEKGHQLGKKVELIKHGIRLISMSTQLQKETEKIEQDKLENSKMEKITYGENDMGEGEVRNSSPINKEMKQKETNKITSRPVTSNQNSTKSDQSTVQDRSDLQKRMVDDSESQQRLMNKVLTEGLTALWTLGKFLVEERVRKICESLFLTNETSASEKEMWAMALLQ